MEDGRRRTLDYSNPVSTPLADGLAARLEASEAARVAAENLAAARQQELDALLRDVGPPPSMSLPGSVGFSSPAIGSPADALVLHLQHQLAAQGAEIERLRQQEFASRRGVGCPPLVGKQLHSDAAQTAHDPSRPKAEVAGLKFRGQSSAVRRTVEFQSRPCYRGAAVS